MCKIINSDDERRAETKKKCTSKLGCRTNKNQKADGKRASAKQPESNTAKILISKIVIIVRKRQSKNDKNKRTNQQKDKVR